MAVLSRAIAVFLLLAVSDAKAFNVAECLAGNSKAVCTRQLLIEEENSKPLAVGDSLTATSGKYTITINGEGWLRNGWAAHPGLAKDLGIIKDAGNGMLYYELSEVPDSYFENTLTEDMKAIFAGLQKGFGAGKMAMSKTSEMELLPLTIAGGNGLLGRFCYRVEVKNAQSICVYEGFIGRGTGESVKFTGSIGDFDNMRAELETIITSFKFAQ